MFTILLLRTSVLFSDQWPWPHFWHHRGHWWNFELWLMKWHILPYIEVGCFVLLKYMHLEVFYQRPWGKPFCPHLRTKTPEIYQQIYRKWISNLRIYVMFKTLSRGYLILPNGHLEYTSCCSHRPLSPWPLTWYICQSFLIYGIFQVFGPRFDILPHC